jgi:hypothetical protein
MKTYHKACGYFTEVRSVSYETDGAYVIFIEKCKICNEPKKTYKLLAEVVTH